MTTLAIQDLAYFSDGSLNRKDTLHFVSSTIDVSQTWMTEVLCGRIKPTNPITLVTFQNHTALHERGLKKFGIESTVQKSQFNLIDLSSRLYDTSKGRFDKISLESLKQIIEQSVQLQSSTTSSQPVIILENPEILVSAGYNALELVHFISQLEHQAFSLYVLCNCDEALVKDTSNNSSSGGSPIASQTQLFISQLIHKSSLFVSIRPFETGRADDVTGVLRVCSGPRVVEDAVVDIAEAEYLYLVASDLVKLYYR